MGYLNKTLERASVQSLREYFLHGISDENYSTESYEIRIRKANDKWIHIVNEYDQAGENSKLYFAVSDILTDYEHVYMELGIQAGFQLAREIDQSKEDEILYTKYKEMYRSLFQDTVKAIESLQKAQKNAEEIYCSEY